MFDTVIVMDTNIYPDHINPKFGELEFDEIACKKLEPYASDFEILAIPASTSGFAVFVKIDNETNASEPRYKVVVKMEEGTPTGYRYWFCRAWRALTEACEIAEGDEEWFKSLWTATLNTCETIPEFGELWIGPVPEELRESLDDEVKAEWLAGENNTVMTNNDEGNH
ncbi:hypothetical protein N7G274_003681 [Stereocaulon virgatum]|uniref:Phage protein n=1 Tax=Stereocaulon virgatum TaxID=373712 RepID=A0ABR4AD07_9LECA